MNKFGYIFFIAAIIFLISGCQKDGSNDEIAKAQAQVSALASSFSIPTLDGYEVSYIQHKFPPKDKEGNFIGDNQEVLVTYTKNKGKLEMLTKEQKASNEREIIYGPFQGETLIEITYTNTQVDLNDADIIDVSGNQVQKIKNSDYTFLVFNASKGSITLKFNSLDEDTILSTAQQVFNENK
ncbi:hypothetical protein R50345_14980 [Paenibacillus sp. FSL R5-0345]|uniref:hypothetical protein n=1 Tax=Paenibacillus sp. FSL R5-0345 TaxID=1536770 RepID=UPI0004F75227|nr:hypothetical protein [Paenibacillus sp. FSL R5-0345]AIQ35814.1 hypothetical protein R50345_14980 [Paenibacillus sp. FSL R5-0345]